ncbi:hypothetical protein EDD21DRAFT_25307 [Dissophora ornata]|nr:hypothetical protein EDD21DRAFT_25307 [Dissophora ornata]
MFMRTNGVLCKRTRRLDVKAPCDCDYVGVMKAPAKIIIWRISRTTWQRVDGGLRVRKELFRNVRKDLRGAFHWSLDARRAFARYMCGRQWNIFQCPSAADVGIALDCQSTDIVISRDSDLTLYRISAPFRGRFPKGEFWCMILQVSWRLWTSIERN